MKRSFSILRHILLFSSLAGCFYASMPARGQEPQNRDIVQVHGLPFEQGAKNLPVRVTGIVTSHDLAFRYLFLQDKSDAIYVWNLPEEKFHPGDRLEITGITEGSFRTRIKATGIRKLGTGPLPIPTPSNFKRIISGEDDCRYVRIVGKVQATSVQTWAEQSVLVLELRIPGGHAVAQIKHFAPEDAARLIGADISLQAVAGGVFDGMMQIMAARLIVESIDQVKILHQGTEQIGNLPFTPLTEIMSGFSEEDFSKRIRVRGILTFLSTRRADGSGGKWARSTDQHEGPATSAYRKPYRSNRIPRRPAVLS